jgi:hypothetical protein
MKRQIVTEMLLRTSKTAPKVLLATLCRLPIVNTCGRNMELKETGNRCPFPNMSGACAPLTHQACMAGSGPRSGLTHFLAATHRKVFLKKTFLVNAFSWRAS